MGTNRRIYGKTSPTTPKTRIRRAARPASDDRARPIEETLAELARDVPQADWDRLPPDLTDNLDHYLYGAPKR